jgi:ribose transport system substrate-binding protein
MRIAAVAPIAGLVAAALVTSDPLVPEIDTSTEILSGARIAVVSKNTKGQFWKLVYQGMEDAVSAVNTSYGLEKDEKVTMTFEGPDDELNVETQINTLDAVIAENPDVLCLSVSDMESCQAQLEAARENGIPVVVFDSNVVDTQLVDAYRSTDNITIGEIAAEKLAEAIGEAGEIAIFSAQEKTSTVKDRVEGFENKLSEYPDVEIVSIIYQDQVEDMEAAMKEVLADNPDLAGVYCTNADSSEMYLKMDKGDAAEIVMVGTDATSAQQEAIRNGTEIGAVSQDPYAMGYQTVMTALAFTIPDNIETIETNVLLAPQWIDADNLDDPQYAGYVY